MALNDGRLDRYVARNWKGALDMAGRCRGLASAAALEGFYGLYEERIRAFATQPPPKGWDGVFIAESK